MRPKENAPELDYSSFYGKAGSGRTNCFVMEVSVPLSAFALQSTRKEYLGRAVHGLREQGQTVNEYLFAHLSPLGWEHINLTGDHVWHSNKRVAKGRFRPCEAPKIQRRVCSRRKRELSVLYFPFRAWTPRLSEKGADPLAGSLGSWFRAGECPLGSPGPILCQPASVK